MILQSLDLQNLNTTTLFQLIENHSNFLETVIIGVQPRGVELSNRILE